MARRQIAVMEKENIASRQHSVETITLQRRLDAAERLWRHLWILESAGHLTTAQDEEYIRALIWMPASIQSAALAVLRSTGDIDGLDPNIEALRNRLTGYAGVTSGTLIPTTGT
jgi:CelD/BcsL family acetyltransferase involved in cellulose biosynthesis